jgi:hypothetical protein
MRLHARRFALGVAPLLALTAAPAAVAHVHVGIGFGFGVPFYPPPAVYAPPPYYYPPPPAMYAPPPAPYPPPPPPAALPAPPSSAPAARQDCREIRTKATIDGKPQEIFGTACRQPDGRWRLTR